MKKESRRRRPGRGATDRQTDKENSPASLKCCISLKSENRPSERAGKRGDTRQRAAHERKQEEAAKERTGEESHWQSAERPGRQKDQHSITAASTERYKLFVNLKVDFVFSLSDGSYRCELLVPARSASLVGGGHVSQILNDFLGVLRFASSRLTPESDRWKMSR